MECPKQSLDLLRVHYTFLDTGRLGAENLTITLYLAEFTEYSIDSLSDMENLRYLSIADENAPAHLFEAETYSELPEDCEVVVNNHHDIR